MTAEPTQDVLEERLGRLTAADIQKAVETFRAALGHQGAADLSACVHCGLCADTCHYALTSDEPENPPAYKVNLVMAVFKRYFTRLGRTIPGWVGARELDETLTREWVDVLFGRCSLCGRCNLNCSVGLNITALITAARAALTAIGLIPPELQSTITTAYTTGNNMGIARNDWVETVQWLEEELRTETGDPTARMPLDAAGARCLYAVNPREPKFFPLSLLAAGKIFHAAGESWTLASDHYDVTNYGLYSGETLVAGELSDRLVRTVERLGCQELILGECGHGFNANRWAAPEWLSKRYPFRVRSVLELMAEYIRDDRIRLDPTKNTDRVTLHDPCNLVRLGGVVEAQRFVLRHAVQHFVEMTPNRENNFCCGGGGGQLAMTRYAHRRLRAGRIKADQIGATSAKVVATPCHNCVDQLSELNKEYKLGVTIKTVCELVADALVLPAQ